MVWLVVVWLVVVVVNETAAVLYKDNSLVRTCIKHSDPLRVTHVLAGDKTGERAQRWSTFTRILQVTGRGIPAKSVKLRGTKSGSLRVRCTNIMFVIAGVGTRLHCTEVMLREHILRTRRTVGTDVLEQIGV